MHSHLRSHPSLVLAVRRLERLNPDKFELYFRRKVSTSIEAKDQEVESLTRAEELGLAVRLVKDSRMGFSYTTSLEPSAIESAVATASEIAAQMPEDPFVGLQSFGEAAYPAVDNHDQSGLEVPVERKIALAKDLERTCRASDSRITGIRKAALTETSTEVHMVDSYGEHLEHAATLFSASVTCICKAEAGGDYETGRDFDFSNFLDSLDVASVGARAAARATELLGATRPRTRRSPAVLRNDVVAELLEFLAPSFSAESIDKGRSMLAGKPGDRIFSELVTLIDDGLLPGGYGTSPFDAEGVPSSRTTLVDGGFVSASLCDGYYARKLGGHPTGTSVRGIQTPPSIGFSNLFLRAGRRTLEDLIRGAGNGVFITSLMGVHTANPVTGDFSLGASGILIENGNLTQPVRGFTVAGNILELLKGIVDVGSDLRFFGSVGAPAIRVCEISIGGA